MKYKRQAKIIKIIKENNIKTQQELTDLLEKEGVVATQATISRDMKELGLIRVSSQNGMKYSVNSHIAKQDDRIMMIFSQSVLLISRAGNLVVVKTMSGMAQAAAAAIDSIDMGEIVGSIAGDDTIFLATMDEEQAWKCVTRLKSLMV